MKSFLFAVILVFPLARAIGQTDSLSDCDKRLKKWNDSLNPQWIGDGPLPVPVKNDPPVYPDSAKLLGKEGTVWIWCIVDTAGMPHCIRVMKAAGWGFDEAAVTAMKKWRFTPARNNHGKLEAPVTIPFKFKLSMKKEERDNSDENH